MIFWADKGWLLLLATLLLLLIIYYLFRRSKAQPVSGLFLWRNQLKSQRSGFKLSRLPLPLNFFLEALVILLLVLAAALPLLPRNSAAAPLTLVLDNSYSMQRRLSDRGTVRDRAEQEVTQLIKAHGNRRIRLLLAGSTVRNLGEFIEPQIALNAVRHYWTADEVRAELAEAMALARKFDREQQELWVFTDAPPVGSDLPNNLHFRALGAAAPNLALVNAARLDRPEGGRVMAVVANIASAAQATSLIVSFPNRPTAPPLKHDLELQPGELRKLTLDLPAGSGEIQLQLTTEDALPFDNAIRLLPEERPQLKVEVDVPESPLRRQLLEALASTGLTELVDADAELVITVDPQRMRSADGSIFYINTEGKAQVLAAPFTVNRNHPLTDGLDLTGVIWGGVQDCSLPGIPLVMGGKTPLLSVVNVDNNQFEVFANLQSNTSTLAETPAWPVLIYNLVDTVQSRRPGAVRNNFRSGENIRLTFPPQMAEARLEYADGEVERFTVVGGALELTELPIGRYAWLDADGKPWWTIQVNALNFNESDLREKTTGNWQGEMLPAMLQRNYWNISFIFILAALAVLALHQYLNRKGRA